MRREVIGFGCLVLSAVSGVAAFADCASDVKSAVETQARADFSEHKAVTALVPADFVFDGGRFQTVDVPVADASDLQHPFVTYTVSVDEVCHIEIQPRK